MWRMVLAQLLFNKYKINLYYYLILIFKKDKL